MELSFIQNKNKILYKITPRNLEERIINKRDFIAYKQYNGGQVRLGVSVPPY